MRNGGFIRGGREGGVREHSCHTSIRATLGKPCKNKCLPCVCLYVYAIKCDFVFVYVWVLLESLEKKIFVVCMCLQMCDLACQALHLYHWPFIHLTVHLSTCLSGSLYASLNMRSLNILMVHLQTKLVLVLRFRLTLKPRGCYCRHDKAPLTFPSSFCLVILCV